MEMNIHVPMTIFASTSNMDCSLEIGASFFTCLKYQLISLMASSILFSWLFSVPFYFVVDSSYLKA
jgi:hypothetical protein